MTLRTGAELSTLALLFNKLSGFYGLLALLTGYALSPLQLSMYIYSLVALITVVYLAPHIRKQSPFECVALAVFFILDTIINALYTTAFGVTWFLVVSSHHHNKLGTGEKGHGEGPELKNVSSVDVAVGPDQGVPGEKQEAVTAANAGATVSHGLLQPESISSIFVIIALWAIRVYTVLIVMNYARLVLRRHVAATSRNRPELYGGSKNASMLEDPFVRHSPEGKGLAGRIGRLMVGIGRSYWLGVEEGDEGAWEDIGMGKLSKPSNGEVHGVGERERRRRSGTVFPIAATTSAAHCTDIH